MKTSHKSDDLKKKKKKGGGGPQIGYLCIEPDLDFWHPLSYS